MSSSDFDRFEVSKRRIKLGLTIAVIIGLCVVTYLFNGFYFIYQWLGIYPGTSKPLNITFVNVGQGDCSVINYKGHIMIVDCGNDVKAEKLSQFLERNNIKSIDTFVGTHPDLDHIHGLKFLLNNYKVKSVYFPKIKSKYIDDSFYYKCLKLIDKKKIPLNYISKKQVKADKFVACFKDLNINFLSPQKEFKDTNSDSIVFKITYGKSKFLFTGDMSETTEKYLLEHKSNVSATVLKVSHHGSRTASSQDFLNAVSPQYVVLSYGVNNYNLPNVEIVNRLNNIRAKIYRTYEDGNITFSTDGKFLDVHAEK